MKNWKDIAISALTLMIISGLVTAALAATNELTADTIAARTAETENVARKQVIMADDFEEQTISSQGKGIVYYLAKQDGKEVGYVFTTTAAGKSAGLTVMTGIATDGTVTGVIITEDNETAGYVKKVEKAGFPQQFVGKKAKTFALKEDVDAVSQATKTSSGICKAVNLAVSYYKMIGGDAQ